MTREEALNELKFARAMWEFDPMTGEVCFRNDIERRQAEILDEAIMALSAKPCEDCVSRHEVLKLFATHDGDHLYEAIKKLPTVRPE